MNHEETIKRIQELVPSVMALEFGCRILNKELNQLLTVTHLSSNDECINCFYEGESNTSWIWKQYLDDNFEILGKPITLAVVLRAIHATMYTLSRDDYERQENSHNLTDYFATPEGGVYEPRWNLSKDNFNDQSDETKTFISELLN